MSGTALTLDKLRAAMRAIARADRDRPPVCADLDEDCADIPDKVHCWLYDPAKGRCPFLSAEDPE